METVLAHIHKSFKLPICLEEMNTFSNAIISWFDTLLPFGLLECLMDLIPCISPVLSHLPPCLLRSLLPTLLGCHFEGFYLVLQILVYFRHVCCTDYVPPVFAFLEFSVAQIEFDLLTLSVYFCCATKQVVALLSRSGIYLGIVYVLFWLNA